MEKKNVYIMGAGGFGKYVYDQLMEYQECWCILGYIDSDINKKDIEKDGVKVYHISELKIDIKNENAIVIIAVTDENTKVELAYQLNAIGFVNILEIQNNAYVNSQNIVDASGLKQQYIRRYEIGNDGIILPIIKYLETHAMDGCNLKCKGCSHFSNLFRTNESVDYDMFKKDIIRLSKICNIIKFRLLGGEPLLNERLIDYIIVVRETFPYAEFKIATNGLLVTKCSIELLKYISANNIILCITMYKPLLAMKEEIVNLLDSYHISYRLLKENFTEFNKVLSMDGDHDPRKSIMACTRKKCLILKQGVLYRCPISAYVYKYNERYGTKIESEKLFDIYTDSTKRLREIVLENPPRPVSTCKYCVETPVGFPWEQSFEPKKEEWLV